MITIHGLHWANFVGNRAFDRQLNTIFHSAGGSNTYNKPYLLIDQREQNVIYGLFIIRMIASSNL